MDQAAFYEHKLAFETDSWDLHVMLEAGEPVTVIDTRSPEAYGREHIPGAINLPHREISEQTTAALPADRLVVTYCDGIGCNASTRGALNMTRLGFKVKELLGGLDWWKRDGHDTAGDRGSIGRTIRTTTPGTRPGCGC